MFYQDWGHLYSCRIYLGIVSGIRWRVWVGGWTCVRTGTSAWVPPYTFGQLVLMHSSLCGWMCALCEGIYKYAACEGLTALGCHLEPVQSGSLEGSLCVDWHCGKSHVWGQVMSWDQMWLSHLSDVCRYSESDSSAAGLAKIISPSLVRLKLAHLYPIEYGEKFAEKVRIFDVKIMLNVSSLNGDKSYKTEFNNVLLYWFWRCNDLVRRLFSRDIFLHPSYFCLPARPSPTDWQSAGLFPSVSPHLSQSEDP